MKKTTARKIHDAAFLNAFIGAFVAMPIQS
jgi:hypothetical protein